MMHLLRTIDNSLLNRKVSDMGLLLLGYVAFQDHMFLHFVEEIMINWVLFCVCTEVLEIDQVLFRIYEVLHIMTCLFGLSLRLISFIGLIPWFRNWSILSLWLPESQQKVVLDAICRSKLTVLRFKKLLLRFEMSVSQIPLFFILQGLLIIIYFDWQFVALVILVAIKLRMDRSLLHWFLSTIFFQSLKWRIDFVNKLFDLHVLLNVVGSQILCSLLDRLLFFQSYNFGRTSWLFDGGIKFRLLRIVFLKVQDMLHVFTDVVCLLLVPASLDTQSRWF